MKNPVRFLKSILDESITGILMEVTEDPPGRIPRERREESLSKLAPDTWMEF